MSLVKMSVEDLPYVTPIYKSILATTYNTTVHMEPQYLDVKHGASDMYGNETQTEMTSTAHALFEYYLNGVIAVIVFFLGIIGNFLTVVVLTRRTMHSSTNLFLTGLALWDMMVLTITLFLITLPVLSPEYKQTAMAYIVVYVYPLALVAQTSTVWITVSFTVERYIAVCHPLRAASMCTIARARIVVLAVSISSVIYNMSRWFEYQLVDAKKQIDNETVSITDFNFTSFGANTTYKKLYFFYLYPLIMFIIPLSTLAILNTCLIMAVKRSQQQQKTMNVRQSRENNVTLMLISVVMVFMMCQVPAMVYNVAFSIDEVSVETGTGWKVLSSLRNFLVTFNSAINFILYCAFGQKFRRIFIRTFCRCLLGANDFNSLTFHATVGAVSKLDKHNKNYKSLLKSGNQIEMSSNMTQHTLISRYSPCVSRSPSPSRNNIHHQNGRKKNGDEKRLSNRLLVSSRTPSPV